MSEIRNEQRRFTRVALDLPVQVHQGGDMWQQRLIDISLSGVATDQPDLWDAQYNEPFTLIIEIAEGTDLELHAYLQHVENGRAGKSLPIKNRRITYTVFCQESMRKNRFEQVTLNIVFS